MPVRGHAGASTHPQQAREEQRQSSQHSSLCISENRATFFLNSGPHPLFIQSLLGPDLYQALGTSSVLGRGCLLCCRGGVSLRTNAKSETQVVNQTVLGLGFHPHAQPCISCFHDRTSSHHTLQQSQPKLEGTIVCHPGHPLILSFPEQLSSVLLTEGVLKMRILPLEN